VSILRGLSPVVVAIVLSVVVIVIASVYYAELSTFSKMSVGGIEIVDAKLVKHYGYARLLIKVYNNEEKPIEIEVKIETEQKDYLTKRQEIPPRKTTMIKIEGKYGYKFRVSKEYLTQVIDAKGNTLDIIEVECSGIELINNKVLILASTTMLNMIPSQLGDYGGSIYNVSIFISSIINVAKDLGIVFDIVEDLSEWKDIVENPHNYGDVIIINPFGGVIPIPTEYIDSEEKIYEFIEKIGNNTRRYGWIWTHITGYPFYYVTNGSTVVRIQSSGIEQFFGAKNIITSGGGIQYYIYTETDEQYLESEAIDLKTWIVRQGYVDIANKLNDSIHMKFSFILNHIPQEWISKVIYGKEAGANDPGPTSGALILRLGNGLYIHWGTAYYKNSNLFNDEELGKLAILSTIYAIRYR